MQESTLYPVTNMSGIDGGFSINFIRGLKSYELTNHLGNVLATVSDRKTGISYNNSVFDHYEAILTSTQEYYPFGFMMPGRGSSSAYRYGFNGQKKSDELSGKGNHTTAEFWEYDSRLGRRWNIDPVVKHYESPFATFDNRPIWLGDPNGMDSTQRNKAIRRGREYIDKKPKKNTYEYGAKGAQPGEGTIDCSGLISQLIIYAGETDPNYGSTGHGVSNIEQNLPRVDPKDVVPGNLATFYFPADEDAPYHIGIISSVQRDEAGNIQSFTLIHSSGSIGLNEKTVPLDGKDYYAKHISGYLKFDMIPDPVKKVNASLY
ncbi:NlpC/P60 family protein [Chitinophaga silvisoli]|uniref:NlpC/P60 domain-containing protein n=1 Tax=Chitinophaga silvisoli TaxID=2291814 RepID=A0A3E1NX60_9BACT|nr:hypothetical protein [Chitinophaga silvisoli]RFM32348.1 hypothetical protein DXN04_21920 [Chitinophaga silvisoli]